MWLSKTPRKPSLDDDPARISLCSSSVSNTPHQRYRYTDPRPKLYHPFTLPSTYMGMLAHEALCELQSTRAVTDPVYARAVVHAYVEIKLKKADKRGLGREYVNAKLTMLERQAGEHWEPTFHHVRQQFGLLDQALIPRPQLSAWARWNQPLIQPPRPQPPTYAQCTATATTSGVKPEDAMWSQFMGGGKPLPALPISPAGLSEKH
ncbi:hypothetical protein Q8F55_008306 [Vanrija albida]|uniref:Uncharacterized protein n=1 Tax=Vanrija albida TaxID=181172 RepID=A0ABR3PVZ6_9TREE